MIMPASSAAAFEAFYNHEVRLEWDTLLRLTYVEGGGTHPYKGAVTVAPGGNHDTKTSNRDSLPDRIALPLI
jgi:hypothetical protein